MRAVELCKVAASAEALRVKRFARRQAIRGGMALAAAVSMLAAFVLAHALAVAALGLALPLWASTLIVLAGDLAFAGALGLAALVDRPGRIEREAAAIRTQCLAEARKALPSFGGRLLRRRR